MKNSKEQKNGNYRRNMLILLFFLALLTVLGWLGALAVWNTLFVKNSHFILRQVQLQGNSGGYWGENRDKFLEKTGLVPGSDNIFKINLRDLRKRIASLPSVESCEVSRIMPDTLVFKVVERIPRASIDNPRSRWVVDDSGVVMSRFESMPITGMLPVISCNTWSERPTEGEILNPAVPALNLLMTAIRNFPDISIVYIDVSHEDKLTFSMRYRNQRLYTVIVPRRASRLDYLLNVLQSTIINLYRSGDTRSTIDLSYSGDAVVR